MKKLENEKLTTNIDGLILTRLKEIYNPNGNILHVLRKNEDSFKKFGEAYFSVISKHKIKAWKRHLTMNLNLTVPFGEVKFVFFDDRYGSSKKNLFFEINLSRNNYLRITVPPKIWFGFKGIGDENLVLNISDIIHDPSEQESQPYEISNINYKW